MPIVRSYMCADCGHHLEVTLAAEQWEAPPPDCPQCNGATNQDFKPVAIGGSVSARANALVEDIITNDYHVANFQRDRHEGAIPKVRYKDEGQFPTLPSTWGAGAKAALESAVVLGRQSRLKHGSGLDVLQSTLKSGAQPDLIEASKRRAIKVWT